MTKAQLQTELARVTKHRDVLYLDCVLLGEMVTALQDGKPLPPMKPGECECTDMGNRFIGDQCSKCRRVVA